MGVTVKEKGIALQRERDNYAQQLGEKKLINYFRSQLRSCTTAHGLPYIVNTEIHWLERLSWAAWFLLSLGVIFHLLSTQYSRYYKNTPIVTSVEMDYFNWNVSYPAISLCPMYKIDDEDLDILVNETLESTGENVDSHLRAISSLSIDTMDIIDFESLNLSSALNARDQAIIAAMIYKKFHNNTLTTSTNGPASVEAAMTEFGMCHVINSNVATLDNPLKWKFAKYVKQNIDLSVYDKDFFIQIMNYADHYKIFIHSPDEVILSSTPSFTTKSRSLIRFGLRVWSTRISKTLKKTPISIRKCRFTNEPISDRYPIYSYNHCILECRIQMIQKLCKCVPHFYKPLDSEKVCNITELQCFVLYKAEILSLSASSENIAKASDLPRSHHDCGCLSNCESDMYMKDSEAVIFQTEDSRMRISISNYPKVRVVRDTLLNEYDLILRSGGVINLCIGASILSLMEIIIVIVKIIASASKFLVLWIYKKALKILMGTQESK